MFGLISPKNRLGKDSKVSYRLFGETEISFMMMEGASNLSQIQKSLKKLIQSVKNISILLFLKMNNQLSRKKINNKDAIIENVEKLLT